MPVQDNDVKKQPDSDEHKSENLLPVLNSGYENYMDKLDSLQEQRSEIQDKISRSESRIAVLQEKTVKLEATNSMLNELIDNGKLPKIVMNIVKANEDKIRSISEKRIPKLENSISKNKDKISRLDERISVVRLKAEKLKCFSNVIKSFIIPNPQKRREMFRESMDGLRKSTENLLKIDLTAERRKLEQLSEKYEKSNSMSEKYKLGHKMEAVRADISAIESRIRRLENAPKLHEASDHAIDKTITQTESRTENIDLMTASENFDLDKPIENVVLDSAEYLRNAEVSMEDDFNMIDGIINNGKQERPDVPLFLEEIDFSICDDATIQAFRDSAKANQECANEITKALSKNYDCERYTLDPNQALKDVHEKFSDDRIAFVIASALNGTADGRISSEVKDFSKNTLKNVPEQYTKRNIVLGSHAGLVNIFAKTFIKSQAEKEIQKPVKDEEKVGLLSFEQFGETRYRIVDETANDILKLANSSEKPFMALTDIGTAVSEAEFAEVMQSTQAKFSVEINFDSNTVNIMAVNGGKGGIADNDRNESNTYFRTAKLSDFAKSEPKQSRSETRKINPDYYRQIPEKDRIITNEPTKVGAVIMTELEKQKVPFSAIETDKGVTITVSKENESAFRNAENKAKDTHIRLVNPEIFKQIPEEDRAIKTMPENEAKEVMQKLDKDGIKYSAKLDSDKSAVTVHKSEAPAYFSRKQMKKLAQEVKNEKTESNKAKNKGHEL